MATFPQAPRINATKVVAVTPTISTSAYTSGNQLGGIMTLADVIRQDSSSNSGQSELVGVTILDSSKGDAAIDIFLFNQIPTITSTDNTPFAITSANLKAQCIGVVSVGVAYSTAAAVAVSSTQNLNKVVQVAASPNNSPYGPANTTSSIYAVAVVRATPTYTSTTALQFQFEFFLD